MKVTAVVGSARKKFTYEACVKFLRNLKSFGDIEYEIIRLSDYELKNCRGCKLCMDKGEELCPLNDDRDKLIQKMMESDGVIFATPNYAYQLSGWMKVLIDRLAFNLHRPCFFGKTMTSVVAQGIYGGNAIIKYFQFVGHSMGFNTVKGCCINTLEPLSEKSVEKNNRKIDRLSKRFYQELIKRRKPVPSVMDLMMFRMARTSIQRMLNEEYRDYQYFKEKGWFTSDYYYPVRLNPVKIILGRFFDFLGRKISSN